MRRALAPLLLLLALACADAQAQQDQSATGTAATMAIESLQQQAARTRGNAETYRQNEVAYRQAATEAREQMDRAAAAAAEARRAGNAERQSYWERQEKYWQGRIDYDNDQANANRDKAAELERNAAALDAEIARLKTAPPPPSPPKPVAAPAPAAPPAEKYRARELAEFVGLWRDKENNVEGVIEGTDPRDPTAGTDITFKGRKLTWEGVFDPGGGDKPAKLTFRYTPKWQEMNEEIPDWARRKVEGKLKWKLVLEPPDDEYACVLPTVNAKWYAGEVTWLGEDDSGSASVTGEGEAQEFSLDKEDDELELHGYFNPAVLIHVGDPQRAMTDPVEFLVQGQRFHVEVHLSKEAARAHSPSAGKPNLAATHDAAGINYMEERDYGGEPATVTFKGLKSGKTASLDLGMALQTRNHPVVRYQTRQAVAITDLWGIENKINVVFEDGETVEASFGQARQQFRFFTSLTRLQLASRDEAFQKTALMINAILSGPGHSTAQRQQADNVLKLVRNARAFIYDVPVFLNESTELHGMNDRARLAIVDKYYRDIMFGKHTRWFGQNGVMASPDNPFGIRWASVEEMEAVLAVMKSPERTRELTAMSQEAAKAGAHASIGLYTTVSYAGLAIAFHATPLGEAYLAWYGEDIYGNRVDWTERVGAALGFGVSVVGITASAASVLNAVRDANRIYTVEKAAEVQSLVEASATAASGERRVLSGADVAKPPASGPGAARRRVLAAEELGDDLSDSATCLQQGDNMADLIAQASEAVDRMNSGGARPMSAAQLALAKKAHAGAEMLEAPAELHPFLQSGGECRLRTVDALEQMARRHAVNPRADTKIAQTRRTKIMLPEGGSQAVWNLKQTHGATQSQVRTYAATDMRARYYNFDLPLADVAELHQAGFGITLALDLSHVNSLHQVALYGVEFGTLGRFLRRPKYFTVFDTNFPSKLFKYKACDLDRLLLRSLRPDQVRHSGSNVITAERGLLGGGRSQYFVDLYQFR